MDNPATGNRVPIQHLSPDQVQRMLQRQQAHDRRVQALLSSVPRNPPLGRTTDPARTTGPLILKPDRTHTPPSPHGILGRTWAKTDGACVYCDGSPHWNQWTRDHVLPKSMGGPNAVWNYVPACNRCNCARSVILPVFPLAHPKWQELVRGVEVYVVTRMLPKSFAWRHQLTRWRDALNSST